MVLAVALALGLGLAVLWIAGLVYHAAVWLTWLEGGAALIAFGLAAVFAVSTSAGMAGSGLLALGLFALWIIALMAGGALWLAWWTFAFGCAFLLLTAAAGSRVPLQHRRPA
jgi:hypothetical protein